MLLVVMGYFRGHLSGDVLYLPCELWLHVICSPSLTCVATGELPLVPENFTLIPAACWYHVALARWVENNQLKSTDVKHCVTLQQYQARFLCKYIV